MMLEIQNASSTLSSGDDIKRKLLFWLKSLGAPIQSQVSVNNSRVCLTDLSELGNSEPWSTSASGVKTTRPQAFCC